QVSIVGGRNIADEYFEAGEGLSFADVDVVAIGDAAAGISTQFDTYWNSDSAYPARLIIDGREELGRAQLADRAGAILASPTARAFAEAIRNTAQSQALLAGEQVFEWTTVQVVHDDPEKTRESSDERRLQLLPELIQSFGPP